MNFGTKFAQRIFSVLHIRISLCTKFQHAITILNFGTKVTQKRIYFKIRKSEHHHWILHIWISLSTKFYSKQKTFEFWNQISPKRVFPVENGKREHHQWILHIRISLNTKFHFKQIIFNFGNKLVQKRYFWSKTEKVNITIEFCIFEFSLCTKLSA